MLLFPALPFTREVDPQYAEEFGAARALGQRAALLDDEALRAGQVGEALRFVPPGQGRRALYRGWMLSVAEFSRLHLGLLERGYVPVTSPQEYARTHLLSRNLDLLAGWTPETRFIPLREGKVDWAGVQAALDHFGPVPLIVKDDVKSRKHEWLEACFIPDASDEAHARRVTQTFAERQGEALTGGIALRAFERFRSIGTHPRSGMPLTQEYRVFFVGGQPTVIADHWEVPNPDGAPLPLAALTEVAERIGSPLFTMDVARREDGAWRVVELGDGQVAGLPETVPAAVLHTALRPLLEE